MSDKPKLAPENPYEGAWLGFDEAVAKFDQTLEWIESLSDEEYRFYTKVSATEGVRRWNGTEQ